MPSKFCGRMPRAPWKFSTARPWTAMSRCNVAKANQPKQKKFPGLERQSSARPAVTRPKPAPSNRRLRLLLGVLLILMSVAVGRWVYENWFRSLPDLPVLALGDVDPEVAKAI